MTDPPKKRAKRASAKRPVATQARGPRLDDTTLEKLLAAIRTGLNLDIACEYVGVPRSTFFDWIRKGRNPQGAKGYRDFVARIDVALAEFEARQIAGINKAGDEEWQARAWLLERKFPDRYGRRTRIDGQLNVTATPVLDVSKLTLVEQEQLVKLLRKASPAQDELPEGQRPALELVAGDGSGEAT